ncbi:glycosyl hydrolase [Paenibacillus oryzisoli]|uniref:glycosyl hydrolase n=1 Tax=Paenibacillus oryzisoli TaxID=1850517 RepID=UPI001EFBABFB|nr:glycosyl hydrolase [Paenibacillus oryzisoli]
MPGIDTLCEQTNESLSIKEVSSVAHQYGKKKVITETYGVTGWAFSFEGRKWIGDWQFVLGVNVLTHHLALYTLRGCRKRDYPPSFNYNVNWWEHNHVMEDYFARLGSVLSEGHVVRDVLVIHPAASVWAKLGKDVQAAQWRNQGGNSEELSHYSLAFNDFIRQLLGEHYDFDLGDELILEEIGSVEGDQLWVGEAAYRVVVLPSLSNLLRTTYKLLLNYLNAGGLLFSFGDVPAMLDGVVSEELQLLTGHPRFKQLPSRHHLAVELEAVVPRTVSLLDRNGREADRLLYMRRELKDCTIVFVVNNDREAAHVVEVRIQGNGRVEEWDLLSGQRGEKPAKAQNGYVVMQEKFGPTDSKLFVISHNDELPLGSQQPQGELKPLTALGPMASFSRTAHNALVLDRCQYQLRDETWSHVMDVWQAQRELREKLNMRQVYMNSNYQRYLWIHEPHENDGTPAAFRWVFNVKDVPTTNTFLACEQAERFQFRLNGQLVAEVPSGWYLDRCMSTLKLPNLIEGENVLEIHCAYTHDMEIENVFLLGDFAIDYNQCLIKEQDKLRFGDWCLQGYPHYCGSMVYHFDLNIDETGSKRTLLEMGPYEAVTLNLKVNGKQGKVIPWRAAGTVDLTDDLITGMNRIDIEVVGSPRNLLGPLHELRTNQAWTDWWSYHSSGKEYTQDYILHPYGLLGQIHIYQMATDQT